MKANAQKQNFNFWGLIERIKELMPVVALIIGLLVGWINVTNELENIKAKQAEIQSKILIQESRQDDLTELISKVNENLASINTALDFLKATR